MNTSLSNQEKRLINKCFHNVSSNSIKINDINFPISDKDSEKIQSLKNYFSKERNDLLQLFKKVKEISSIDLKSLNRIKIKKTLISLEKRNSLTSKLLEIYIYKKLKLSGKVNSLMSSIINKSYIEQFFYEIYLSSQEIKINNMILEILNELEETIKNKSRFEALIAYLMINLESKTRKELSSNFSIPDRLSYVREKTLSYNNGALFPHAWSFWIEKYSSEKELLRFFDRGLIYGRLDKEPHLLVNFYSVFPLEKKKRSKMVLAFEKLYSSKKISDRELSLRILAEGRVGEYLKQTKKIAVKPLFRLEKEFYLANLFEKKAPIYSIYRLLGLGVFKSEFLLYLYASRL